jgi:hypothetical protein
MARPCHDSERPTERTCNGLTVQESSQRSWIEFAAVLVFAVGLFRIIATVGAFESSHRIIDLRHALFGNQFWVWGVWDLAIAVWHSPSESRSHAAESSVVMQATYGAFS